MTTSLSGTTRMVQCEQCGVERLIKVSAMRRPNFTGLCHHCNSKSRRGSNSPMWKGGRRVEKGHHRYIRVKLTPDNFFFPMAWADRYVLEHRLVMAQHLGRCLHSWEIVHHLNGNQKDNNIENLQLVTDDRHTQITVLEVRIAKLQQKNAELKEQVKTLQRQLRRMP